MNRDTALIVRNKEIEIVGKAEVSMVKKPKGC
jgi:hypothetical protein